VQYVLLVPPDVHDPYELHPLHLVLAPPVPAVPVVYVPLQVCVPLLDFGVNPALHEGRQFCVDELLLAPVHAAHDVPLT
jgi:hypothetical protein